MRLVFFGPPGSGKGTQTKLLGDRLRVPTISTGDILRAAVSEGSPLGRKAKAIMEAGELVPDDLVVELVRERLSRSDARSGFILDGFPRTREQAEALDRLLARNAEGLTAVLNLLVPEPVLVERMRGRLAAEGRSDDRPATIPERLRVYHEKTEPLVGFYRDKDLLVDVNGLGTVDEVAGRIESALTAVRPTRRAGGAA